jgi:hypothetical protein
LVAVLAGLIQLPKIFPLENPTENIERTYLHREKKGDLIYCGIKNGGKRKLIHGRSQPSTLPVLCPGPESAAPCTMLPAVWPGPESAGPAPWIVLYTAVFDHLCHPQFATDFSSMKMEGSREKF